MTTFRITSVLLMRHFWVLTFVKVRSYFVGSSQSGPTSNIETTSASLDWRSKNPIWGKYIENKLLMTVSYQQSPGFWCWSSWQRQERECLYWQYFLFSRKWRHTATSPNDLLCLEAEPCQDDWWRMTSRRWGCRASQSPSGWYREHLHWFRIVQKLGLGLIQICFWHLSWYVSNGLVLHFLFLA